MSRFEVGRTYTNSAAIKAGHPCGVYTVTKRTAKAVWISEDGRPSRRVMLRNGTTRNAEFFKPYGAMVHGVNVWANGK